MSSAHLTTGSVEPPRVKGLLRLYSMKFCPYAQRIMLVLKAKAIPHDVVNINLINKPEWYFKIHPQGKVPALLDGDKVIIESLDISDYLDEKYPENPLYPAEPEAKRQDKELIQKIGPLQTIFYDCMTSQEEKTPEEWLKVALPLIQVFEDELVRRGTPFFGGQKPGMVDYMLWPWAERASIISIKLGAKLPFANDHIPRLRKWRKTMRDIPICAAMYATPEKMYIVSQYKYKRIKPDYDSL